MKHVLILMLSLGLTTAFAPDASARVKVEGQIYKKVEPKRHSGHFPRRVDFNTPRAFSTIRPGSVRFEKRYNRGRNRGRHLFAERTAAGRRQLRDVL